MTISASLKAEVHTWSKVVVIVLNVLACLGISALAMFYLGNLFMGEHEQPSLMVLSAGFVVWVLMALPLLFAASRISWRARGVVAVGFVVYAILAGVSTTCAAVATSGC